MFKCQWIWPYSANEKLSICYVSFWRNCCDSLVEVEEVAESSAIGTNYWDKWRARFLPKHPVEKCLLFTAAVHLHLYPFCTFVISSTSSVPSFYSSTPFCSLILFQYPFCTFLLSRTSSVPLQSSSTIHCLLNSYCLKIREEKCHLFKGAVHHMYTFSTFILSSTSNHCLLYHNNSKLQILFTNQLGEMPSSEKPPSSKQHCTLIPSSTSPVPQFTITAQLLQFENEEWSMHSTPLQMDSAHHRV